MLGAFGDGADGGFEVEFGGLNFNVVAGMNGAESGGGMGGVGDAELAALGEGRGSGSDRRWDGRCML